jgi:hypothetical protein
VILRVTVPIAQIDPRSRRLTPCGVNAGLCGLGRTSEPVTSSFIEGTWLRDFINDNVWGVEYQTAKEHTAAFWSAIVQLPQPH